MSNYTIEWIAGRLGRDTLPESTEGKPLRLGRHVYYRDAAMLIGVESDIEAEDWPPHDTLYRKALEAGPQGPAYDAHVLRQWTGEPVWPDPDAGLTWGDKRKSSRIAGVVVDRNRLACLLDHATGKVAVSALTAPNGPAIVLYGDDWRAILMALQYGGVHEWVPSFEKWLAEHPA